MANPNIDGTHSPTKIAPSLFPINHRVSEKTRERNAERSINISALVSFLNIKIWFVYC